MIDNFFKLPGSDRIISKKGLRGITPFTQYKTPYIEFQYEHAYMRIYFKSNDLMFESCIILEKELNVKTIGKGE